MLNRFGFILLIVFLLFIVFLGSIFIVYEGQRSLILQFGSIWRDSDEKVLTYDPGLHFKLPFLSSAISFDARLQTLDGQADRFVTSEKKDVIIDSYVKWRISDFERYYVSTGGNRRQAESRLQAMVNNGLRSEVGSRTIKDLVSSDREEVMDIARNKMGDSALELGILIVDMRIKKINLPDEVSSSIYQRMRAERRAVAVEHRSQGREKAEFLRSDVDARVKIMLADASLKANILKSEGDGEASLIYTNSYMKSPDFFDFYRSMQAYAESLTSGDDVLIISPDSTFFKYLKGFR